MAWNQNSSLLKREIAPGIPKGQPGSGVRVLPTLRPLGRRPALVEQVAGRLRQGIIDGHFPPESELPSEGNLAKSMEVSHTVIREAMRTLRSQGLVDVSQGRRPRVRPVGPEAVQESLEVLLLRTDSSLHELTDLRRLLEVEIASMAAERVTKEQLKLMQQAIDEHAKASDLDRAIEADMRFHDLLAEASGNMLFPLILSTVAGLLVESRRRTISRVGVDRGVEGHRAVLAALREKDAKAARVAMREHIQMIIEDLGLPSENL